MVKTKQTAGADNLTPSIPQYFSWINNTNEGATERQTIINLDFFKWLKSEYGMEIRIYAWDAGNFDGASKHYGADEKEKLEKQFPEGYKNVVAEAKKAGIRMGLWGSPDGYGDDEKTQNERFEFFVHLCRDYNFAEFKLDGVCGTLRPEKAGIFREMLCKCREYSPDLVVLNHRLEYYEANDCITTDLWNGQETYTDILSNNEVTAPHHRAYLFRRGHTEELNRLMEDHGVCISSCIDYFEDELIYQAFGRCLILAPEIYGNPWLMKDAEFARLARIYNLHRRNAPILVNGIRLPEDKGANAVSRGTGGKRFICTGCDGWEKKNITLTLDGSIGIETKEKLSVNLHFPYEKHLGDFMPGETVEITLLPFRACLIEVAEKEKSEIMLPGCEYEIVKESKDGEPLEVILYDGVTPVPHTRGIKEDVPEFICEMKKEKAPQSFAELYETAAFAADNDALEARSLKRSGETAVPQVRAAREAFFAQKTYRLRGCEAKNMFDGKDDTFFDAQSRSYRGEKLRTGDGCLRIDFGRIINARRLEIVCFAAGETVNEILEFVSPGKARYGTALTLENETDLPEITVETEDFTQQAVVFTVHNIISVKGRKLKIAYSLTDAIRYFALPCPPDRIYSVRLFDGENEIPVENAGANNMQAAEFIAASALTAEITLPEATEGRRLTVAVDGESAGEDKWAVAEYENGVKTGFTDRAPSFIANMWEHRVCGSEGPCTFYLPLKKEDAGKKIKITVLLGKDADNCTGKVYICDSHK